MKKTIFSSIVLAMIFAGCGGDSGCCDASKSLGAGAEQNPNLDNKSTGKSVAPVAAFTHLNDHDTFTVGQSVPLDASTSTDADGSITSYNWTIDGKPFSTEAKPKFTFEKSGSHEICLTVTDDSNMSTTKCKTVNVKEAVAENATEPTPQIPSAEITLSDSDEPLKLYSYHTFSCLESYDNDDIGDIDEIKRCDWEINSYRTIDGKEVPFRHCSAENTKEHEVQICTHVEKIVAKLTVTDNEGQTHTTTKIYTDFTK